MNLRLLLASAALALAGCQSSPRAYLLPRQEPQFEGFKPHTVRLLNMEDADAPTHFVRDIQPELHANWRWSLERPAIRIKVHSAENLKYMIDFTLPEVTFHDTGPVEIAFTADDHVLDRVRYEHAGSYHFEKEIPAGWLKPEEEAMVGAQIDKLWTSPLDGAQFGFIITRMGLAQ